MCVPSVSFTNLPPEVVILILQNLADEDIVLFIKAYPQILLHHTIIKQFVCFRLTVDAVLDGEGVGILNYQSNSKLWLDLNLVRSLTVRSLSKKERRKSNGDVKYLQYEQIIKMKGLRRIKIVHHNAEVLIEFMRWTPQNVEVIEIVLDGPLKGKKYKNSDPNPLMGDHQIKENIINLKMITIINTCKWNRNHFQPIPTRAIVKQVKAFPFLSDFNRILRLQNYTYTTKLMMMLLSTQIVSLIERARETIQNIGIFGIDACWILAKMRSPKLPAIRLIKVGGESMARCIIWKSLIFNAETKKVIFQDGKKSKPMIVIFSKMFKDQCKVVMSDGKCVLIGGSGYEMFQKYTFM